MGGGGNLNEDAEKKITPLLKAKEKKEEMEVNSEQNDMICRIKEFAPPYARTLYENWIDRSWQEIRMYVYMSEQSQWRLNIDDSEILRFGRRMRALAGSKHGYFGKASLALHREKIKMKKISQDPHVPYHLIPHCLFPCPCGELLPEISNCVGLTVGDVIFRVHPAPPGPWCFELKDNDPYAWPQISDILYAILHTCQPIHFEWYLVVTPYGVVKIRLNEASRTTYSANNDCVREKNLKDLYQCVYYRLINKEFTQESLTKELRECNVDIEFLLEPKVIPNNNRDIRNFIEHKSRVKYCQPICGETPCKYAPCNNFVERFLPPKHDCRQEENEQWFELFCAFHCPENEPQSYREVADNKKNMQLVRLITSPAEVLRVRMEGRDPNLVNGLPFFFIPTKHLEHILPITPPTGDKRPISTPF